MSEIDWDKAPEWATHWCPGNARIKAVWIYRVGNEFYACYADKGLEHIVDFPAWRFARLIPRPSSAWSGEGLPPVGVVCEANFVGEWRRFELRYYGEAYVVFKTAFEVQRTRHDFDTCGVKFRPIRTPEQIAADEREAAIKEMLEDAGRPDTAKTRDQAQLLYDAGWRKQPKP